MRKFIIFFVIMTSIIFSKEKVVFLLDENYPPYSYTERGVIKGIYPDILALINKNMSNYEIVMKTAPWARALKMIENGEAEYITDVWYRPSVRPYLEYSVPVLDESIIMLSYKGSVKKWPDDFKNKKIGINRGFAVFTPEEAKLVKVEEASFTVDNIRKLINNRIDYFASDKNSFYWDLQELINKKVIKLSEAKNIKVSLVFKEEYGYIGFRKNSTWKNKKAFENELNNQINILKKNGSIDAISKKHLKFLDEFE